MSAFYDIWIGQDDSKPLYIRDKGAWDNTGIETFSCWLSATNKNQQFTTRLDTPGYSLIILGQFYEPVNSKQLLQQCIDYIDQTSSLFEDPAGHYLIFLIDKVKQNCHVFTNRLGTYHAYWLNEEGNNTISTHYLGLAKQTKSKILDWEGITGFLGMGFFPGNTTYLKNIKILEPATHYGFDRKLNLLSSERYWEWSYEPSNKSLDEYIDQLHQTLQSTIGYIAKGAKVAIPISGGLDSRTIAGVVSSLQAEQAASLWGFSYGYDVSSVETHIAEKIAKSRQIPFNHYTVPNYLFDKLGIIASSVELFHYIDGTRQACMSELLEQKSDVVLGGHWGDVWMDSMGINDYQNDLLTYFHKKIIKKGGHWLLKEVCDPYMPNSKQYLDDYFMTFINQYQHIDDIDFRMKIYKTEQWSFRWTLASIRMYQAGAFPILPFYDRRIVELFRTIPSSLVKGRYLQIEYLKKYHPDLARVKWQEYGANLYLYKWLNNRNIIYRVADKVKRTISSSPVVRRNWEIFYLNSSGRKNIENILLTPAFNDIVPAAKINILLDEFYKNPSAANGYTVSMLVTFGEFVKTVF